MASPPLCHGHRDWEVSHSQAHAGLPHRHTPHIGQLRTNRDEDHGLLGTLHTPEKTGMVTSLGSGGSHTIPAAWDAETRRVLVQNQTLQIETPSPK
jgi:hypothetical protein